MKVLIETQIFYGIQGDFTLILEVCGYNVIVKEVGPTIQVLHSPQTQSKPLPLEGLDFGFE